MSRFSELLERQLELASLTGEIDAVMAAIAEGACQALDGDGAAITVPRGDQLVFKVAVGAAAPLAGSAAAIASTVGGQCFTERRSLVISDLRAEPRAAAARAAGLEGSVALAPLVHGDRTLGVLSVHAREPHTFGDDAATAVGLMARSAAIALRNAELVARLTSAEETSRALVEQGPDAMLVLDSDGAVLAANDSAATLLGYSRDELMRQRDTDLFADEEVAATTLRGPTLQRRRELRGERRFRRKDGSGIDIELAVRLLDDGRAHASLRDITQRKRNEDRLHESLDRLRSIVEMQREIAALALEPDAVTVAILERAQRLTGADGAVMVSRDENGLVWRQATGAAAPYVGYRLDASASLANVAATSAETHYSPDTAVDPRIDQEAARRTGFRSVITAPILRGSNPIALLSVAAKEPHAFDEMAVETTRLMAEFISAALRGAEELEARRRLGEELRTQGLVVEHMRTALHVWTLGGDNVFRLEYANGASEQALDLPVADAIGRRLDDVLPAGAASFTEERFRELLAGKRSIWDAGEVTYDDGRAAPRELALKSFALGPTRVAVTFENVTEHVRAVRALSESEERFRGAFDAASAGMALVDLDNRFVQVNDRLAAMLGYAREELLELNVRDITDPADHDLVERNRLRLEESPAGTFESERRYVRKDGSLMWGHLAVAVVRDYDGRPLHRVVHLIDVSRRKEAEELFSAGFERSVVPMAIVDDDRAVSDLNGAAVALLGVPRDEALGLDLDELLPDQPVHRRWQRFLERGVAEGEATLARPDGAQRLIEFTATANVQPGRHMVVLRDLTRQRDLEQQLRHAQRMEAVGRLAGGIAHDFNNLLTAIGGYSEFLADTLEDPKTRRHAEEIRKAAARAAALTGQLLAFSRRQVLQPRVVDLNAVVTDMESMLRRLIGEDVELITTLDPELGPVRADPTQIEQVIVNLAVNARDAMPGGGSATIATADVSTDAGDFVELSFTDTGVGMSRQLRQHLFDPFFTTKEGGTGLGLATVYGVVEQSGGTIEVDSEPGLGSSFRIRLPRVASAVEHEESPPEEAPAPGSETILLVEDEGVVRSLVAEILETSGYTVLQAADGPSALELLRRHAGPVDLLVTDVVMPGMSGPDVAKAVSSMRPGTQVLYTSGYTDSAIDHHGVLRPGIAFLQKPFSADDLTRKVRDLVEDAANAA